MKSQRLLWLSIIAVGILATLSAQVPRPTFEVASVRPNLSGLSGVSQVNIDFQQNRFVATSVPLRWLIAVAYAKEGREPDVDRIVGGPSWIDSAALDIQATTANPTTKATMRLMLQALLDERFGLRLRTEQRNRPGYALLLNRSDGRLGPQLKPAEAKTCAGLTHEQARDRRCGSGVYFDKEEQVTVVYGSDADMDALIDHIAGPAVGALDRPVVNRTGLTGRFDFELRFSIAAGRVNISPAVGPNPSGTPIFTALRQQLGLKLDPVTALTEVLVIDSVQQPTEN